GQSWTPFTGPGDVRDEFPQTHILAVDPAGQTYVAFNSGGYPDYRSELHVSRNGGAGWSKLVAVTGTQYLDLRIDPSSAQTLLLLSGVRGGVFGGHATRSVDGGAHWTDIDPLLGGSAGAASVLAIALDSQTPGRVYAAAAFKKFGPLTPLFLPVY